MMTPEPQAEHRWLQRMLGDWTMEGDCGMGPGQPSQKTTGTETVRSLGGLWVVGESKGEVPGGGEGRNIITLGFDPAKGRFVGSFISSMMGNMWLYEGSLEGQVLTLDCEGPDFANPGQTASYKDIMELVSDDHRILTSRVRGPDGQWHQIMQAQYRRVA